MLQADMGFTPTTMVEGAVEKQDHWGIDSVSRCSLTLTYRGCLINTGFEGNSSLLEVQKSKP